MNQSHRTAESMAKNAFGTPIEDAPKNAMGNPGKSPVTPTLAERKKGIKNAFKLQDPVEELAKNGCGFGNQKRK